MLVIDISGPKSIQGSSNGEFKYTRFHNIDECLGSSYTGQGYMNFENCIFEEMNSINAPEYVGYGLFTSYNLKMTDCLIRNSFVNTIFAYAHQPLDFKRNTIDNISSIGGTNTQVESGFFLKYNNFLRFKDFNGWWSKFLIYKMDNYGNGPISLTQNNIIVPTFEQIFFLKAYGSSNVLNALQQYWGTTNQLKIDAAIYDFNDNSGLPEIRYKPMMVAPSDSAHAIVWKVLVNGKDAQDEVVEPVGVGKQKFDVYFNRSMDKTIIPLVSFGVRYPYSSQAVNEDGSWSEDAKIYTVYKTIKLTTGDGINKVRVSGAKEVNGWEHQIPVEDSRFSFIISAANSSSNDFMATPGLGKVALEWNNNDLEDGLGFNMYRMEHLNDSTLSNPVLINETLITDTVYSDFSVIPNNKYYYYYKVLRTNLNETDSSKVVSATPFTASKGDANGDLAVNVLDITSIVAYLLNQNPQPFIFEAGDVNSDNTINVLDIIGVVQKIGGFKSEFNPDDCQLTENAFLRMEDGKAYLDSRVKVAALQFELSVNSLRDFQILSKAEGFEFAWNRVGNKVYGVFFSLSGALIEGTNKPLFEVSGTNDWTWTDGFGATPDGCYVPLQLTTATTPNLLTSNLLTIFPNPFTNRININYSLESDALVILGVYDIQGRLVKKLVHQPQVAGSYSVDWQGGNSNGKTAPSGIYIIRMEINSGQGAPSVFFSEKVVKSGD